MPRALLRSCLLSLALVGAACSDSPVASPDASVPSIAAGVVAPAATDAVSLQAALDAAAATGGTVLVEGEIVLSAPLTYLGDRDLTLIGREGARIVGPGVAIAEPSASNARVGEETSGDGLQILGEPDLRIRNRVRRALRGASPVRGGAGGCPDRACRARPRTTRRSTRPGRPSPDLRR